MLKGQGGDELLSGGTARDVLIGGHDADMFPFTITDRSFGAPADITRAGGGAIAFQYAGAAFGDRIKIEAIDANKSLASK